MDHNIWLHWAPRSYQKWNRKVAQRPYPSFWMYKDNQNKWRWTYEASNGKTIAVSSESYNRRADCQRGVEIMQGSANSEIWMPADLVSAA